ncbi:Rv1535 domain-containing protein [Rhodococcus opacus]|uniref:Rv1535 domain-containing protein n=1 Tax=Rhodococcus opacus TaxID=37919 RepID=UPI0031FC53A4
MICRSLLASALCGVYRGFVSGAQGGSVANSVVDVGGDPVVSVVARVFTPPLRELYALLVRVGVIEIIERTSLLPPAAEDVDGTVREGQCAVVVTCGVE